MLVLPLLVYFEQLLRNFKEIYRYRLPCVGDWLICRFRYFLDGEFKPVCLSIYSFEIFLCGIGLGSCVGCECGRTKVTHIKWQYMLSLLKIILTLFEFRHISSVYLLFITFFRFCKQVPRRYEMIICFFPFLHC